jgi:hypothetical protein
VDDVFTNMAPWASCVGIVGLPLSESEGRKKTMSQFILQRIGQRTAMGALALLIGCAIVVDANAIHPRRRVVVYDAGCGLPASVGPGSLNPAGFGFGGYSYGGYPYYGYWGYMPGPYAGFSGYGPPAGPAYGMVGYSAYPAAIAPLGAPGCGAGCPAPAACAPICGPALCDPCTMTPCAYRRYLRRMYRAMAWCSVPCVPAAGCSYGALLGADVIGDDDATGINGETIEFQPNAPGAESVAPPAQDRPSPSLDRTF